MWYHYFPHYTVTMSMNFMAVAVIFPITTGISMAFKRREDALRQIGVLLGNLRAIWDSLHTWLVPGKDADGRKTDDWVPLITFYSPQEREKLETLAHEFLTALIAYFALRRT